MGDNGKITGGTREHTVVLITGYATDGEVINQEMPLAHDSGVAKGDLLGRAATLILQAGGLFTSGPGGELRFYPVGSFKRLQFNAQQVSLVRAPLQDVSLQ